MVNGCVIGGLVLLLGYWFIKFEEFDMGIVVGFDKYFRGVFNVDFKVFGLF